MIQPVALWGLPRLSGLPPERRKLVLARYRQLNERASWQKYAVLPLVLLLGLVGVAAVQWVPSLLQAVVPRSPVDWVLVVFASTGAVVGITPALVVTPSMRKNYRLALGENGLCAACGYDLRATPEEGGALFQRCPECGHVPAAKAAT